MSSKENVFTRIGRGILHKITPPMEGDQPQRTLRHARFAAVDFESAGAARGLTDVPVQIGIALWSHANEWEDGFVSFLHSSSPVTWAASQVHGITSKDLINAPRLTELWPEVRNRLSGSVVVAHGRGTEKKFLRAFPGHGFGPWIDTLVWSRRFWPAAKNHSLSSSCELAGVVDEVRDRCPGRSWHDALFDATASLALLRWMMAEHELFDLSLDALD